MDKKEPKIIFVDGLERMLFGTKAICLAWINEIHIDSKYQKSDWRDALIEHELFHYRLLWTAFYMNSRFKRLFYLAYNNLWELFSEAKVYLKVYLAKVKNRRKA